MAGLEAAQAHGDGPHVKVVMPRRRSLEELRQMRDSYETWNPPTAENKPQDGDEQILEARQATTAAGVANTTIPLGDNSMCGPGYGRCADGYCCSASGWCGQGSVYCNSPDCQISYGPACDGNQKPAGRDTSDDPRPLLGNIPYGGVGIFNCVNDGDVAITYDDGPYIYTAAMLDAFKAHGAVATWFITGTNIGKGMINVAYADVIQRMVAEGHQIASHTWSHENLDSLTLDQRKKQMVYNEIAFTDILGFYPTYMRPPYSICGAECQNQMVQLGYHITFFDLDTQGYLNTDPSQIGKSVALWDAAMVARSPCNGSYLHIEHDIHQQIATTLTNHILDSVVANGWNAVTVGTCLGDPPANWYRGASYSYNFNITPVSAPVCSATPTLSSATAALNVIAASSSAALGSVLQQSISTDATCGASNRKTCLGSAFGNCCSQYGYCGSTTDHCGTGCQTGFGNCTVANAVLASSASNTVLASSAANAVLVSPAATNTAPAPVVLTSLDGYCGTKYGNTSCLGSVFGNCCSQYGYCGSTTDHCGTGCQTGFGNCTVTNSAAPAASSSVPAVLTSLDGYCGTKYGNTSCLGSVFGNCCSHRSIFGIHGLWGSAYFIFDLHLESVHRSFVWFVFCNYVSFVDSYIRLGF
ncbi:polysaccharide deacetylase [Colletotrichum graminicola M1.001]|uniref:Polysaccharide deacetylase n=1 Tax=Colletotrichum graminicola (strain M1.001 / M2 / FGSC 10212) TaxID=645133 RepID=E3QYR6_COLGM|nr:polysaccharide deacetylase [Colletotrichum graminicola M1.001]EFQ36004.1 polysaccharide deacetylase [Colletotrichum graminicola M1.001]